MRNVERVEDMHYRNTYNMVCRNCGGRGTILNCMTGFELTCLVCDNTGIVTVTKDIYVTIKPLNKIK